MGKISNPAWELDFVIEIDGSNFKVYNTGENLHQGIDR
jgi:hypothetical protein